MTELVATLLFWITMNTTYYLPESHPYIEYRSKSELQDLYYGNTPPERRPFDIVAIFNEDNLTIYLEEGFDMSNKENQATLVHELAHYLQKVSRKYFECAAASEPEAYRIERLWRKKQGMTDPHNDLIIAFMGMCPSQW